MFISDKVRNKISYDEAKQEKLLNSSPDEYKIKLDRAISFSLFHMDQMFLGVIIIIFGALYAVSLYCYSDPFTPWMGAFGLITLLTILILGYTWDDFRRWAKLVMFRAYMITVVIYSNLVFVFIQKEIKDTNPNTQQFLIQKIICFVLISNLASCFYRQTPWIFYLIIIFLNSIVIALVCVLHQWTHELLIILISLPFVLLNNYRTMTHEELLFKKLSQMKNLTDDLTRILHDAKVGRFSFTSPNLQNESSCVGYFPQTGYVHSEHSPTKSFLPPKDNQYNDSILHLKPERTSLVQLMESLLSYKEKEEEGSYKESLKETMEKFIQKEDTKEGNYFHLGLFQLKENPNLLYNIELRKNSNGGRFDILLKEIPKVEVSRPNIQSNYKNVLLAKISHEFKGPMMLIQNTIDLMLEKSEDSNMNDNLHKIKYLAEIVLLLILDISEFTILTNPKQVLSISKDNKTTKLQHKYKENLSVVEMRNLKEYLVNMCRVFCSIYDKNLLIQVIMDEHLQNSYIVVDDKKVKQILSNLLSNAVKFSVEASSIKVTFKKNSNDDGTRRSKVISLKVCGESPNLSELSHKMVCVSRQFSEEEPEQKNFRNFKSAIFGRNDSNSTKNRPHNHSQSFFANGFTIFIEDSGNGLDQETIGNLNRDDKDKFNLNEVEAAGLGSPIDFEDYLTRKGLGSGLLISKKLCYELGVDLKCMLINDIPLANSPNARGTRFILNFPYEPQMTLDNTIETNRGIILNSEDKDCLEYSTRREGKFHFDVTQEVSLEIRGHGKLMISTTYTDANNLLSDTFVSKNMGNSFSSFLKVSPIIPKNFSRLSHLLNSSGKKRERSTIFSSTEGLSSIQILPENAEEDEESPHKLKLPSKEEEGLTIKSKLQISHRQESKGFESPSVLTPRKRSKRRSSQVSHSFPSNKFNRSISPKGIGSRKYSIEEIQMEMGTKKQNPPATVKEEDQQKDKILIIDDNGNYAKSIENLIKRYYAKNKNRLPRPFSTKILSDGIELVYEIYKELTSNDGRLQTKVIFSDQMMVYMNGSEAYTIIKNICKDKQLKEIPYIICSAFVDNSHKEKMIGYGLKNVYQKPITMGNIEYILEEVMKDDFLS